MALDPAVASIVMKNSGGERRKRTWEAEQRAKGNVVTYRGIPPELREQIKAIAVAHHVKIGEVARRFLEHGLEAYQSGDLELRAVEIVLKATLYPKS